MATKRFAIAGETGSPLAARAVAALTLAATLVPTSCASPSPDTHTRPTTATDGPVVTGEPAGYNSDDIRFAYNMIAGDQEGIDIAALVSKRSTDPAIAALAGAGTPHRQSEMAILKVLLVQWNENPNTQSGPRPGMRGLIDQEAVAKLNSLRGSEFDALWRDSINGLDAGAVEMATNETLAGKNVDAIDLAKQIRESRQVEIGRIRHTKEN